MHDSGNVNEDEKVGTVDDKGNVDQDHSYARVTKHCYRLSLMTDTS